MAPKPGGIGCHTTGRLARTVPLAPCSIQSCSRPSSSGLSGSAATLLSAGGMMSSGSRCAATLSNKLAPGFFATTAGPVSPPFKIVCGVSRISPPLGLVWL